MRLRLIRIEQDSVGTYGMLHIPECGSLYTVERPWLAQDENGQDFPYGVPSRSCVPVGEYELIKALSPSRGMEMYYLQGEGVTVRQSPHEPKWRWGCMFHIANYPHDVLGCIGLGFSFKKPMVSRSGMAFTALRGFLEDFPGKHTLSITECYE